MVIEGTGKGNVMACARRRPLRRLHHRGSVVDIQRVGERRIPGLRWLSLLRSICDGRLSFFPFLHKIAHIAGASGDSTGLPTRARPFPPPPTPAITQRTLTRPFVGGCSRFPWRDLQGTSTSHASIPHPFLMQLCAILYATSWSTVEFLQEPEFMQAERGHM